MLKIKTDKSLTKPKIHVRRGIYGGMLQHIISKNSLIFLYDEDKGISFT